MNADVCLADVTSDNPNVWFELGYAISGSKDVILICSEERKKFPFDVQHRKIIRYSVDSPQDFEKLRLQITEKIKAILKKQLEIGRASKASPIVGMEGLSNHEMVALVAIAENLDHPQHKVEIYQIRQDMMNTGYTKIAVTVALQGLLKKQMVEVSEDGSYDNIFTLYGITEKGMTWLLKNQDNLVLRQEPDQISSNNEQFGDLDPDDFPF